MIRLVIPYHLRKLAGVDSEVEVDLAAQPTLGAALDALEARYPVLRGTFRDQTSLKRRPFIRYFACKEDFSHEPLDTLLPPEIIAGSEPLLIIGAMAGG